MEITNRVVQNAVIAKALNACARNGAYDTFEIRKDPKYGNFWCIYPQGVSVRAVSRVFDTPEIAKKYVRDNFPGTKVRVKNACGTARNATENDVKQALAEIKGLTPHVTAIKSKIRALRNKVREITHFQSGLDYKVSSQVSDAYDKLMADLWEAANAG